MNDSGLIRGGVGPPRRFSATATSQQNGETIDFTLPEPSHSRAAKAGAAVVKTERRNSVPPVVHQRHMPKEVHKFHIPKKTEEKRALFQCVSTESREYEDIKSILTSSYLDSSSTSCFTYSKPRLVYSELLEKEFVEKRKEMKTEGRTEKELEESYCFLLSDTAKLAAICERGLLVGHSWVTVLGNPAKGVYLSRYSDLLQPSSFTPASTGELIIFKVMKGKVKSIYENMKNLLDPTPRFDSHIAKNASKVTSVTSYRAFELTQHFFYEYLFDELRQRPRQVCPYAVVSFQIKGKDTLLPSKPLTPDRSNIQSSESSKERTQFTVWSGNLVKDDWVLFHISLLSLTPPFLPFKLPEKLEIGCFMRFEEVAKLLPTSLFSHSHSHEVVKNGLHFSLLEVLEMNRVLTSVSGLLQELERKKLILVIPLKDRSFLFLLSSIQMTLPTEEGAHWKRSLQALFVSPESRHIAKSLPKSSTSSYHDPSESLMPDVMPQLKHFIPALHQALAKARANPPPDLSASVELQAREYLTGLNEGKLREYPMGEYDSTLDEKQFPFPRLHRASMDRCLRSYLYGPTLYLLSVARAKQVVQLYRVPEEVQEGRNGKLSCGGQRGAAGREAAEGQSNREQMQQLIDLVLTCKRNAENEIKKEQGDGLKAPGKKRRAEQQVAERALKRLRASQEPGTHGGVTVEGIHAPSSPVSFSSVFGLVGLKNTDLREDESELAAKLAKLLTGLHKAANQTFNEAEEEPRDSYPFDKLASKLGLPTHCDIDLRKQDELEEQTAGSISSLEGFSPGSHSGEGNHHGAAARGARLGRSADYDEEEEVHDIPWVLIPITGVCSERYSHRDKNILRDPRLRPRASPSAVALTINPPRKSPTLSLDPSPPPSPSPCPSPEPSPPPSPSLCPSPEPSPPPSPSQRLSPQPSPLPSPSQSPSSHPVPAPSPSPSKQLSPRTSPPPLSSQHQPNELSQDNEPFLLNETDKSANEEHLLQTTSRELTGVTEMEEEKSEGNQKNEEPCVYTSIQLSNPPAPEQRTSPPPTAAVETETVTVVQEQEVDECELPEQDGVEMKPEEQQDTGSGFPAAPFTNIDSIVNKHLGDFSSELHLLLQDESIHYSFPQSPCSTPDTSSAQHTLPYSSVSQFSQYVSFYSSCSPMQDYMSSLKDSINSMLTEFDESCSSSTTATTGRTKPESTLAKRVSAFVAGVRAANTGGEEDEVCRSGETITVTSHPTLPAPTSASVSVCEPTISAATQFQLSPEQSHGEEIGRTITHENGSSRTVLCTAAAHGETDPSPSNIIVTLPGLSGVKTPPELVSTPEPSTALSSLINQLQPDVFSSLAEIMKEVKRNSLQFYIHLPEADDPVDEEIKEHLLKQGNVEQSPSVFLKQEMSADNRLLVIVRNKDIADHIHKIPELVSLKRCSSVVFVGIDTLDDIRNSSYNELFISGGCIVSNELILSPDYITSDRLAALLMLLEQNSSLESVWRWKIHFRTHKKLKEQARFRRDAASLLELLSAYQRRQIVEFLPYHDCDMLNRRSPDMGCLLELQARYTQFRHTVFLTDHLESFPAYSGAGIIMATVEEILNNFTMLVGCHDIKDKQPITDELLPPKDLIGQPNQGDVMSSLSSVSADHIRPLSSASQSLGPPQHSSGLVSVPRPHNQLPLDASCKDDPSLHPDMMSEFHILHRALAQLRAERQAQLQQLQQRQQQLEVQAEVSIKGNATSPLGQGGLADSDQTTPVRKAAGPILGSFIHSVLQPEEEQKEIGEERGEIRREAPIQGLSSTGGPLRSSEEPFRRNQSHSYFDSLTVMANQNSASVTDSAAEGDPRGETVAPCAAEHDGTSCIVRAGSVEDDGERDAQENLQQPMRGEDTVLASSVSKATGRVTMVTEHRGNSTPTPRPQQLNTQHQRALGVPQTPHLPQFHHQYTSPGPMMGPLASPGLLGPVPMWGRGSPLGPVHLMWGLQRAAMDFSGPRLLGGYHNPGGQGGTGYRRGSEGGGGRGL
ncbi:protein TASOR-like [Pholidichthys leucotaenia]